MAPELCAWYLDDGTIGGDRAAVAAVFDAFRVAAAPQGLVVNAAKCEVISADHAADASFFPSITRRSTFADWSLLGCPCGSVSSCDAFAASTLARAAKKPPLCAALEDTHVAVVLLRYCASFCLAVHVARSVGPAASLVVFDATVRAAFEAAAFPVADAVWGQCKLPLRFGGLGFRAAAEHASLAFIASTFSSSPIFPIVSRCSLVPTDDPLWSRAAAEVALFNVPRLTELIGDARTNPSSVPPHFQRVLSSVKDAVAAASLVASASLLDRARLSSVSAPHASGWLQALPDPVDGLDDFWLDPSEAFLALRIRLGLPLSSSPAPCLLCKGHCLSDPLGHHSLSCMGCGRRSLAHTRLKLA